MNAPIGSQKLNTEDDLAARAAWLYFSAGLTQAKVAERLGVPNTKAHRLVARATREGLVRVFVDAPVSECLALENALIEQFGLTSCRIVPDLGETGMPFKALAPAGALYLRQALESGGHTLIGVGHGRTLAAAVREMPTQRAHNTRIVSLLGGLTRKFAANPYDVIHQLAEKTGAEAYLLPVPLFANSAADKAVLMAQMGAAQVFELASQATLLVAGIGDLGERAHLSEVGSVTEAEMEELRQNKAVGEILGHYFDAHGAPVRSSLNARAMSIGIDALRGRNLVAVAGGAQKHDAIMAVLRSGLLSGLISDEATARRLITQIEKGDN